MSDRRQRQKEQRAAKREAERKQESRKELWRRLRTALIFGLIVVGVFAFSGVFSGEETDLPGSYEDYRAQPTACGAGQPPPEQIMFFDAPEPQNDIASAGKVTATLVTSCGDIVIELDPDGYPETANSFVFLAREGFFDDQVFHRITENFKIEGGDPVANGTGGPGYIIADEFPDDPDFLYEEGVVAMSNSGARSTGSQFFIVVGEDGRHLTASFNVLGRVVSGQDSLTRIVNVDTVGQGLPLESIYIESVTIDVAGS